VFQVAEFMPERVIWLGLFIATIKSATELARIIIQVIWLNR
jgi:hypothetical protein